MPQTNQALDDRALLDRAREAAESAYVPYSRFPVGAALHLRSGVIVTGCNVENASYGLTICAERTAVTRMVAQSTDPGERQIVRVAIIGLKASPCYPCGACRQVLHEFGCQQVIVEESGEPRAHRFSELLPFGFGPSDLA
ncbi:cytidine deaminase [Gephyromycinifex aptenodytis]|uniref:cytidine deaminase n=1 Tax=Gephyromycinifex aptenodytis TaxID=2716227 RepID=UPI001D00D9CD|nr:cytidine deaminase [Gephyromycinifex aptenodytis]